MRKFLLYFTALVFVLGALPGCGDDKSVTSPADPIPPVLGDIVAVYSNGTLKLTIDGAAVSPDASVAVVQEGDGSMTLELRNIVPGVPKFVLPESTFEVVSRSAYACNLGGTKTDNLSGYKVTVAGQVADSVLTAMVTLDEIEGVLTNVVAFRDKTYKGNMTIEASDSPSPIVAAQRMYTFKPTGRDTSSIKLQIINFSISGLELGNISIDTIKVLKRGNVYGFKAEGRTLKVDGIGDVTLDVRGTFVDKEMTLSLAVNAGSLLVNVGFAGKQVTETTSTKLTITMPGDDIFKQPVMRDSIYTFSMWSSVPAAKQVLTPTVVVPEGAVIDSVVLYDGVTKATRRIEFGTPIDFSAFSETSCVKYYVMPEDVRYAAVKSLFIARVGVNPVYTMEEWVIDPNCIGESLFFFVPKGLASSNSLAVLMQAMGGIGLEEKMPIEKAADNAAEIRTYRTVSSDIPNTTFPGVTAGMLFNGQYAVDFGNTLSSTKFGELYEGNEPEKLKFTYKYSPGSVYMKTVQKECEYMGDTVLYNATEDVPNMQDSCSISAYLYKVENDREMLDGTNINTSSKVIAKAVFYSSLKTSYEDVEVMFVPTGNGEYTPGQLYKLAIVCSSSRRGNQFMGAPGSLLTVKRLEVTRK